MTPDLDASGGWRAAPTLVAGAAGAVWLAPDGEIEEIDREEAGRRWEAGPAPLLCHAPATRRRTGARAAPAFDILELAAFCRPAGVGRGPPAASERDSRFAVPTPRGLARSLGLADPRDLADQAMALRAGARRLLEGLAGLAPVARVRAGRVAAAMIDGGWIWGGDVADALDLDGSVRPSLDVWSDLDEWSETAPRPPGGHHPVSADEILARLDRLLGDDAERREEQRAYAAALAARVRAAPANRRTRGGHRRGRHGRRQDAGLHRAGQPVGREEQGSGLDQHLHPQPPAPGRPGTRPPGARPGRQARARRRAQGPRELRLPAQSRRGRQHRRRPAQRGDPPGPRRPLGRGHPRRRHDRRRLPGLARGAAGRRPHPRPRRPARRVRPCRLPPLPEVLHRALHPPRALGRPRGRQPRARPDPDGARRRRRPQPPGPLCLRRGAPPVRRRRRRLLRAPHRARGRGPAPLAARRGGPPLPGPRAGPPRRRPDRRRRARNRSNGS